MIFDIRQRAEGERWRSESGGCGRLWELVRSVKIELSGTEKIPHVLHGAYLPQFDAGGGRKRRLGPDARNRKRASELNYQVSKQLVIPDILNKSVE